MNIKDFEIEEIPYWCRNCYSPASKLLCLPQVHHINADPIYQVCECCFNELCNEELEKIRKRPLHNESDADWVKRANEVSEKYGFGSEHAFCLNCGCPQPHEPDCIECSKETL